MMGEWDNGARFGEGERVGVRWTRMGDCRYGLKGQRGFAGVVGRKGVVDVDGEDARMVDTAESMGLEVLGKERQQRCSVSEVTGSVVQSMDL